MNRDRSLPLVNREPDGQVGGVVRCGADNRGLARLQLVALRERVGHGERRAERGALHAQRRQKIIFDDVRERLSRCLLRYEPGQPVAGVRIGIDIARLREESLVRPGL